MQNMEITIVTPLASLSHVYNLFLTISHHMKLWLEIAAKNHIFLDSIGCEPLERKKAAIQKISHSEYQLGLQILLGGHFQCLFRRQLDSKSISGHWNETPIGCQLLMLQKHPIIKYWALTLIFLKIVKQFFFY